MSSILFEKKDQVAKISLNRPKVFNSFNREMALSLQDVLDQCSEDKEIRAIYLTAIGKAFCAGQDLNELMGDDSPSFETILSEHYNPIIERLRSIKLPVVGAINGVAAGAGANLALACDITVAKDSASFIQAFSKIGLIPDSGGTFTLPRLIGWQRAAAFMMLGEKVTATDAAHMGMIYKSFPDDQFEEASWKLAATLAKMPTQALAHIKDALNQSLYNNLTEQLALEEKLQVASANTDDYQEGINAFLEKRKPTFKGK